MYIQTSLPIHRQAITDGEDYFYAHGKGEERFGKLLHIDSCHGLPAHVLAFQEIYRHWLPAAGCPPPE
jgi:hypothetical protein